MIDLKSLYITLFAIVVYFLLLTSLAFAQSTAVLEPTLPETPRITGLTPDTTSVKLEWYADDHTHENQAETIDYTIQYSPVDNVDWKTFDDGISTEKFTTITNLQSDTEYYFKVAAINETGQGNYSRSANIKTLFDTELPTKNIIKITECDDRPEKIRYDFTVQHYLNVAEFVRGENIKITCWTWFAEPGDYKHAFAIWDESKINKPENNLLQLPIINLEACDGFDTPGYTVTSCLSTLYYDVQYRSVKYVFKFDSGQQNKQEIIPFLVTQKGNVKQIEKECENNRPGGVGQQKRCYLVFENEGENKDITRVIIWTKVLGTTGIALKDLNNEGSGPVNEPSKKSSNQKDDNGSGNEWNTRPTFGLSHEVLNSKPLTLVKCGLKINDTCYNITDNHHTDFNKLDFDTGETIHFEAKVYAPSELASLSFLFGIAEIGRGETTQSELLINVSQFRQSDQIQVLDYNVIQKENNIINKDSVLIHKPYFTQCMEEDTEKKCVTIHATLKFNESPGYDIFALQAIDEKRRPQTTYLNDGIGITGESLNESPTVIIPNKKTSQQTENLTLELTRTDKPTNTWTDKNGIEYLKVSENRFDRITPHEEIKCNDKPLSEIKVPTRQNCNFRALSEIWS